MSEDDADDSERDARFLRAFLLDRDAECPKCQYNLRNLTGDRCPECGEQIVLRVNLAEPKIAAMIAGLVGLTAGAGFSGLLVIYCAIRLLMGQPGGPNPWEFAALVGIPLLVEGSLAVLWIVKWREIRRMPNLRRNLLVVGAWVATLVNIVVFSVRIR